MIKAVGFFDDPRNKAAVGRDIARLALPPDQLAHRVKRDSSVATYCELEEEVLSYDAGYKAKLCTYDPDARYEELLVNVLQFYNHLPPERFHEIEEACPNTVAALGDFDRRCEQAVRRIDREMARAKILGPERGEGEAKTL